MPAASHIHHDQFPYGSRPTAGFRRNSASPSNRPEPVTGLAHRRCLTSVPTHPGHSYAANLPPTPAAACPTHRNQATRGIHQCDIAFAPLPPAVLTSRCWHALLRQSSDHGAGDRTDQNSPTDRNTVTVSVNDSPEQVARKFVEVLLHSARSITPPPEEEQPTVAVLVRIPLSFAGGSSTGHVRKCWSQAAGRLRCSRISPRARARTAAAVRGPWRLQCATAPCATCCPCLAAKLAHSPRTSANLPRLPVAPSQFTERFQAGA